MENGVARAAWEAEFFWACETCVDRIKAKKGNVLDESFKASFSN